MTPTLASMPHNQWNLKDVTIWYICLHLIYARSLYSCQSRPFVHIHKRSHWRKSSGIKNEFLFLVLFVACLVTCHVMTTWIFIVLIRLKSTISVLYAMYISKLLLVLNSVPTKTKKCQCLPFQSWVVNSPT